VAESVVSGFRIAGLASAVPSRKEGIEESSLRFGAETAKKVAGATGVHNRRVALPGMCTSDLCFAAATALFEASGRGRDQIGGLIFVSQTPDYFLPATSHLLQDRLGLGDDIFAFDVNLGCSGYIYGLWLAAGLAANTGRSVLLLVGDTATKMVGPEDQSVAMLFGDAGTATIVDPSPDSPPGWFHFGADGSGAEHLIIPAGGFRRRSSEESRSRSERADGNRRSDEETYMNGAEVFAFTLRRVPPMLKRTLELASCSLDQIDAVILHQANAFMLEHLRKKMKIPAEKFVVCMSEYGNTSSATIPLAVSGTPWLTEKGQPKRLLLGGFGVGLSWGAAVITLDNPVLPPVVECGEEAITTFRP
jgi:3-oxoacyl-[acyl-carrier-protein] synthase III